MMGAWFRELERENSIIQNLVGCTSDKVKLEVTYSRKYLTTGAITAGLSLPIFIWPTLGPEKIIPSSELSRQL